MANTAHFRRHVLDDSGESADEYFIDEHPRKRRRSSESADAIVEGSSRNAVPSRINTSTLSPSDLPERTTLETVPTTNASFESINVAPWLVRSMRVMEIRRPTPIQKDCIPEILKGRDCIGGSRTGTGKTIAFAVPILQKWAENIFGIYAVVLTPTRELALQIFEQFQALGRPHDIKVVLVTGGSDMRPQALALSERPHIVIATPGRLADHIKNSGDETTVGLKRARVVVLDEADRLLTPGHGSMLPDLETCLKALPPPSRRSTLLFTATVTPEVRAMKDAPRPQGRPELFISEVNADANNPQSLIPAKLKQTYLQMPSAQKLAYLHVFLQVESVAKMKSIIVFCNRTKATDLSHRVMMDLDHSVTSLHSKMAQSQRNRNLSEFRAHKARILIATDVAARGLDIPNVDLVINLDVPRNPDDYIHRVGRTARAGKSGISVTFTGERDIELIFAIEEHVGSKMSEWKEEGVNVETRLLRGRVLKDVGEARMGALRDLENNKDIHGRRKKGLKRIS